MLDTGATFRNPYGCHVARFRSSVTARGLATASQRTFLTSIQNLCTNTRSRLTGVEHTGRRRSLDRNALMTGRTHGIRIAGRASMRAQRRGSAHDGVTDESVAARRRAGSETARRSLLSCAAVQAHVVRLLSVEPTGLPRVAHRRALGAGRALELLAAAVTGTQDHDRKRHRPKPPHLPRTSRRHRRVKRRDA
jgi:hypothetical protein